MPEIAAALAAQHISAAEEAPHLDGSDSGSDSDESCSQVHTLHGTHLSNLDVLVPILVPVASGASTLILVSSWGLDFIHPGSCRRRSAAPCKRHHPARVYVQHSAGRSNDSCLPQQPRDEALMHGPCSPRPALSPS